jgi:cysteine sulfinate desulfinase/cysteine desulfurase-like protein
MGLSNDLALSSFRISLESNTHIEGIEFAVKEIAKTVNQLKRAMV